MDCCFNTAYNQTFDLKRAEKEMHEYLQKGPKKTTRNLLEPLRVHLQKSHSLLDIGSGTGALIWELLKMGINKAYYFDISQNYARVFSSRLGTNSKARDVKVVTGDFTEHHQNIPQVDAVTLDKVICCYEDYHKLLTLSLPKASKIYAYTIPQDLWWVKGIHSIETFFKKFSGKGLATQIHPVVEIERLVLNHGFNKVYQKANAGWLTAIYHRG